jgi:carbon starvation protein
MFEALFILTTVDAGTRVARFLIQEFGGHICKPLGRQHWVPGIVVSSLAVVGAWGYLIDSGNVSTIWPMFGVSNQLLAAIALGVGTTLIIKAGKTRYILVTLIPMMFMFITTLTASWQLMMMFMRKASQAATPAEALNLHIDTGLLALMAVLAIVAIADMVYKWYGYLSKTRKISSSEVVEYVQP